MTTAIAKAEDLTPERVALLKRTLCPDLSNDEMELLAGVARRTGLDPFAKQIYGIKRKGKLTIQTGIDGFRVIAARTGELDGQEGPFWCGEDGVWRDVWTANVVPVAAKVVVWRKGCRFGFTGIARTSEYTTGEFMWNRMAANQIAKCAESLALRKAFPADLSGLYTSEEMEQADAPEVEAKPPAVAKDKPHPLAAAKDRVKQLATTFDKPNDPVAGRDPVHDTTAVLSLCYQKGFDWAQLVMSLNAKFGMQQSVTQAWEKFPLVQREAAVAQLRGLPDLDTADELTWLLERVAKLEKSNVAAVFQRFQVAAKLPESCIGVSDLDNAQIATACKAFRFKLAQLREAQKGGT